MHTVRVNDQASAVALRDDTYPGAFKRRQFVVQTLRRRWQELHSITVRVLKLIFFRRDHYHSLQPTYLALVSQSFGPPAVQALAKLPLWR